MKKGLAQTISFKHVKLRNYRLLRREIKRVQLITYLTAIALVLSLVFNFVLLIR